MSDATHPTTALSLARTNGEPPPFPLDPPVPEENLFAKLHRALRGRYILAFVLAALGAAGGAYLGLKTSTPLYTSQALLYVEPSMPSPADPLGEKVPPMLNAFIDAQVALMGSRRVLLASMESPGWRGLGRPLTGELVEETLSKVRIDRPRGGLYVTVSCTDEEARAAAVTVQSLVSAYERIAKESNLQADTQRLREFEGREKSMSQRIEDLGNGIITAAEAYGGPRTLEATQENLIRQIFACQESLAEIARKLRILGEFKPGEPASETPPPALEDLPAEEIALRDQTMYQLLTERSALEEQLRILLEEENYLEQHRKVVDLRRRIEFLGKRIEKHAEDWNRSRAADGTPAATPGTPPGQLREQEIDNLRKAEQYYLALLENLKKESKRVGDDASRIDRMKVDRETAVEERTKLQKLIEQLRAELSGTGRVRTLEEGTVPSVPSVDKRFRNAFLYGFGLGGFGVFLVLLLGLFDRHLRTSRDVGGHRRTLRVLGLLPDLAKKAPEGSAVDVATYAVHQIRSLLQISHGGGGGTIIHVTGPAVGVGKTMLALGLGLSYATSGARVLLLDADVFGRGLTKLFSRQVSRRLATALGGLPGAAEGDAGGPVTTVLDFFREQSAANGFPDPLALCRTALGRAGLAEYEGHGLLEDLLALLRITLDPAGREEFLAGLPAAGGPEAEVERLRFELQRSAGLLRALEGERLEACLLRTDHPRLFVLPVPAGSADRASELSLSFIGRLLDEARQHFDATIVDTGPVPGSFEASLVASRADAVVLTVSRGSQRSDLLRAVEHLRAIEAKIVGAVFNRAEIGEVFISSGSRSLPHAAGEKSRA